MASQFMIGDEHRLRAAEYLRVNADLRDAIGADGKAVLDPRYLGVGEHNRNFWFVEPASGRKYVLRLNVVPQPFHADQVAYEFAALEELAPSGRTPAPVYRDSSHGLIEEGALVLGFCEGDELDFDHLRKGDLRCAAQIMADIHALSVSPQTALFRPRDPLGEMYRECEERYGLYRQTPFADERVIKWVDAFFAAARPVLETPCREADCAHIVNTEPLPSHFLIPVDSAVAAAKAPDDAGRFCDDPGFFVDWERPIVGEVAQDVAYFTAPTTTFWDSEFLLPADAAEEFAEDYWRAVDGRFERGGFDERFRAFRVMTALRSVTWCCLAVTHYNSDSDGYKTEKTARKLPVYLSDDFMEMLASECFGL